MWHQSISKPFLAYYFFFIIQYLYDIIKKKELINLRKVKKKKKMDDIGFNRAIEVFMEEYIFKKLMNNLQSIF